MILLFALLWLSTPSTAQNMMGCWACKSNDDYDRLVMHIAGDGLHRLRQEAISRCFRNAPVDDRHFAIRSCLDRVDVTNPKEKK